MVWANDKRFLKGEHTLPITAIKWHVLRDIPDMERALEFIQLRMDNHFRKLIPGTLNGIGEDNLVSRVAQIYERAKKIIWEKGSLKQLKQVYELNYGMDKSTSFISSMSGELSLNEQQELDHEMERRAMQEAITFLESLEADAERAGEDIYMLRQAIKIEETAIRDIIDTTASRVKGFIEG